MNQKYASIILFFCLLAGIRVGLTQPQKLLAQADSLTRIRWYDQSEMILNQLIIRYPERQFDLAEAHYLRSYNQLMLGDFEAAAASNETSLHFRKKVVPEEISKNYLREGDIFFAQHQYTPALKAYSKALELPLLDDPQTLAMLHLHTGTCFERLENDSSAIHHFQQSWNILSIEEGDKNEQTALAKYHLANALISAGDTAKGLIFLYQLTESGQKNKAEALAWMKLGEMEEKAGALAQAENHYAAGLHIASSWHLKDLILESQFLLQLAELAYLNQEWEAALQLAQEVVVKLAVGFDSSNPKTNPDDTHPSLDEAFLIKSLNLKSRAFYRQYLLEKNQDFLSLSGDCSRLASSRLHKHIGVFKKGLDKKAWTALIQETTEVALETVYQANTSIADFAWFQQVLDSGKKAEWGIQDTLVVMDTSNKPELSIQEKVLRQQWIYYERLLLFNPDKVKNFGQALKENRNNYLLFLENELKKQAPEYYKAHFESIPFQMPTPDELLISYYVGQEQTWFYTLSDGKGQAYKAALSSKDMRKASLNLLQALNEQNPQDFAQQSFSLYQKLIAPYSDQMKKKQTLLIGLHDHLDNIPLEALTTKIPSPKSSFNKLDYLIHKVAVVYQTIPLSTPPNYTWIPVWEMNPPASPDLGSQPLSPALFQAWQRKQLKQKGSENPLIWANWRLMRVSSSR
ncbi:MAG TPA: hypothetical protein PKA00_20585 [Saprospiraceae bacterium]|nr:hypothetical protein [Saprospiraceae bacterium]HMQ85320.1 hypothetical protein [Saprospiraceae bacterium]